MGETRFLTVQSDYHKVQVPVDDIMYITIDGRKTKLSLADGSCVRTNKSLRDVFADLPGEVFDSVNRGIVVSKRYVKSEKKGVLTMKDGTQFKRRVRSDRGEKSRLAPVMETESGRICPVEELNWWLGDLPMPMCVLELVYRGKGGNAAFVMRYCNLAMETLEGVRLSDVRDQPAAALKIIGSEKWLTAFADVAINGGARVVEDMLDGRYLRLHCYRPQPGCCAIVMTDLTRENNLVQKLMRRGR